MEEDERSVRLTISEEAAAMLPTSSWVVPSSEKVELEGSVMARSFTTPPVFESFSWKVTASPAAMAFLLAETVLMRSGLRCCTSSGMEIAVCLFTMLLETPLPLAEES